jgi:Peptidase family C25/Propeptide_C25
LRRFVINHTDFLEGGFMPVYSTPVRRLFRSGGLLLFGLLVCFASAWAAEIRLISTSDDELIFELTSNAPSVETFSVDQVNYLTVKSGNLDNLMKSDQPSLPIEQVLLALPPGTEAVTTVIDLEEAILATGKIAPHPREQYLDLPLETRPDHSGGTSVTESMPSLNLTYVPDPVIYGGTELFPPQVVTASPGTSWRHLRVSAVQIHPVRYDPATQQLIWYPRLQVRVRFVSTGAARSATPPVPYRKAEGRWESIFKRTLLNYDQARSYKRAPLSRTELKTTAQPRADFALRLTVARTDIYRVSYEELADSGVFSGSLPWSELSLTVRGFDDDRFDENPHQLWSISFLAEDNDQDDLFGPGDNIVFFGQDAWDFFNATAAEKRYLRDNIYWLTGGGEAGTQMDELPDWYDVDGLTPHGSSPQTLHYEEDLYFGTYRLAIDGGDIRQGHNSIRTDHYCWTYPIPNRNASIQAIELNLPRIESVSRIDVFIQSLEGNITWNKYRLWLSRTDNVSLGSLAPADTVWSLTNGLDTIPNKNHKQLTITDGFDEYDLWTGRNYLKIYTPYENDGFDNVNGQGVSINWVDIACDVEFQLTSGRLAMNVTGTGVEELRIKKLTHKNLYLFDVSDSTAPQLIPLGDDRFTASGSRWNLDVQVDFGLETNLRQFLLVDLDMLIELPSEQIEVSAVGGLPTFSGEDIVAIYPSRFAAELEPLLSYRESQGHRIYRAPIKQVYDAYSGGRHHPFAIKRLMKTMWYTSDPKPDYLLLVGDGSLDIPGYTGDAIGGDADSTYLPVLSVVGHVSGSSGYELAACDHWYVDGLEANWNVLMSTMPDLHLGRIPCESEAELARYVSKVIEYEQTDAEGEWRNRIVVHSDDSFSEHNGYYSTSSSDRNFNTISNQCLESTSTDIVFDHYDIVPFYHSDIMDSVAALGRCVLDPERPGLCKRQGEDGPVILNSGPLSAELETANTFYGLNTVNDNLIETLSSGALIWAYQGHSMRQLLSHEYVFQQRLSGAKDVVKLTNYNRPFFFIGAGCHLGDFADPVEGHNTLGGDAMAEVMLFCCDDVSTGAIAALGSTDYESIGHRLELHVFEAMFSEPAVDTSNTGEPLMRWRLGDLITTGKAYVSESANRQRVTYTLLGDPALRMGISPPILNLTLNDEVWNPNISTEYVSQRSDDSLHIAIVAYDESTIPLPVIQDYFGTVPEDSIKVTDQSIGGRHLTINYQTQLQRRPYNLIITARDYTGTTREVTISVPMDAVFYELASGQTSLLTQGARVNQTSAIIVSVRAGVHLETGDFKLLANGEELSLVKVEEIVEDQGPYRWQLETESLSGLETGTLDLTLQIRQLEGDYYTLSEMPLEISVDENLRFRSVWWIPSPFNTESTLVYDLTQPAAQVRLKIFTAAGRCLLEQDSDESQPNLYPPLPTGKGIVEFDAPIWDGRDDDGDEVANGLYFFELTAWDEEGKIAHTVIDKLVRVR